MLPRETGGWFCKSNLLRFRAHVPRWHREKKYSVRGFPLTAIMILAEAI